MKIIIFTVLAFIVFSFLLKKKRPNNKKKYPPPKDNQAPASIPVPTPNKDPGDVIPLRNDNDPYFCLSGPLNNDTPKELIPLLDTIRTKSEWKGIFSQKPGFEQYINCQQFIIKGCYYGFTRIIWADKKQQEAIKTGKKCLSNPRHIADCILYYGCTFNDFIEIDEDVKLFCVAQQYLRNNQHHEALTAARKAVEAKPNENWYNDLLFDIRLEIGDLSSIDDAMEYYINDMDSIIHQGKIEKWIRTLLSAGEYEKVVNVILKTDNLLDELATGKRKNHRYYGGDQQADFARYKKEQFNKHLVNIIGFKNVKQITEEHKPSNGERSFRPIEKIDIIQPV